LYASDNPGNWLKALWLAEKGSEGFMLVVL
jgi:hypothetical protein